MAKSDHKCYSEQEGDWVVFRCPLCPDYERRIHSKTGEMKTEGTVGNMHKHHGVYVKPGFGTNLYCSN
ncbi:MAG TPA: hypothetical protein ENJ95_07600 [Bacteroidetes bacterium]|nr:hypothetical protein [Bacteroidota bacterium]